MYKNPKSGRYYRDFWFEGERYQQTLHVKTRSIAKTLEAKFKTEVMSGRYAKKQQQRRHEIKFKVAMEDYLSRESINLKSHERNEYSSKHLLPFFGNTSLSAVTQESITNYKVKRKKENAKGATCNRVLALLKRVFNWYSQQHQLRIDNPVKGIEFFKEVSRDRIMTEEEEHLFFTKGKPSPILRDFVRLALRTGMRTSEMIKLKTSDIVLGDLGGYIQLRDTKTGDNRRCF